MKFSVFTMVILFYHSETKNLFSYLSENIYLIMFLWKENTEEKFLKLVKMNLYRPLSNPGSLVCGLIIFRGERVKIAQRFLQVTFTYMGSWIFHTLKAQPFSSLFNGTVFDKNLVCRFCVNLRIV